MKGSLRGKSNGFSYYFRQSLRYFWSNKGMSVASAGVLASCLFIMLSFMLVTYNINNNIIDLEQRNEIVAFINEEYDEAATQALGETLRSLPNIEPSTFEFIPRDVAFENYKEQFEANADIFEDMDENPLRDSYKMTLVDLEQFDQTLELVENAEGVEYVRSRAEYVDSVLSFGNTFQTICFWIMLLLFIASLFIIGNTVRISRFLYAKQIKIMKYIGATDWFIRWPFILEGGHIGVVAGVIAFFMTWYVYHALLEGMSIGGFIFAIVPFENLIGYVLAGSMAAGLAVGILGSAISIRRYLDA